MNAIDATAMAIFIFEGGYHPKSRNVRDNNPGNLEPIPGSAVDHEGAYRTFKTFSDGWLALTEDIAYKIAHHLTPDSTMVDFFNLYAPAADHNDPHGYAQFVCGWVGPAIGRVITLESKIKDIYV
jgi:hypothetical protein